MLGVSIVTARNSIEAAAAFGATYRTIPGALAPAPNLLNRECRCEQGFGDPLYPNPGLIAPLRAREETASEGGDSPRQCFLSCFQSNICMDVV